MRRSPHRHASLPTRTTTLFVTIVALIAVGFVPARADDDMLVGPCKPHPTHHVHPGCVDDVLSPDEQLPNLVPNVDDVYIQQGFVIDPETGEFEQGGPHTLYFATHAQNLGHVPLQITFDGMDDADTAIASQCVAWTLDHVCRKQRPVGGFEWHAQHSHFHFTEFARYELRRLTASGAPDYSDEGLLRASDKVSFCLMDTRRVDPAASPAPFYALCTPGIQGVSPGWTDIYGAGIPGQEFDFEGLSDGRYAIVVDMDYRNRLFETSDDDNVVEAIIEVSGNLTAASVVSRSYP